jgi:hypothetical protein
MAVKVRALESTDAMKGARHLRRRRSGTGRRLPDQRLTWTSGTGSTCPPTGLVAQVEAKILRHGPRCQDSPDRREYARVVEVPYVACGPTSSVRAWAPGC